MKNDINILLLASQSVRRAQLLQESHIPFKIIEQHADESACDWNLPLEKVVTSIAISKMKHSQLLAAKKEGDYCFVLTADTLGCDNKGMVHGKPRDKADAIAKIKALKHGIVATAFCLEKKYFRSGQWQTEKRHIQCVTAEYIFDVPEQCIDDYLENIKPHYLQVSGAIDIEGYGAQFLKSVNGSYSTILGLPMYEVRQALNALGFFNS